jgi:hypothetical protein
MDVKTTFLHGDFKEVIYMTLDQSTMLKKVQRIINFQIKKVFIWSHTVS